MNDVSLRLELLKESRQHLAEAWRAALEFENFTAEVEGRAPKAIPAPTSDDVLALADQFFRWATANRT